MLAPLLQAHPDRLTGDNRLLADKAYVLRTRGRTAIPRPTERERV